MRRKMLLISCALAALIVLPACGTSGGSDGGAAQSTTSSTAVTSTTRPKPAVNRAAYSVGLNEKLMVPLGQDDACVSGRMVDAIGVDRLNEAGVTPEQISTSLLFTLLHPTDADRAALKSAAAAAFESCGTSRKVTSTFMKAGIEDVDVTPFVDCAAANAAPRLVDLLMGQWSGTLDAAFADAAYDALAISTTECPEYQVAVEAAAAHQAGGELSPSQEACFRQAYTEQAARHQVMTDDEYTAVLKRCI